ncbi:carboxymuconolactone decarboxylase family protein [Novosphingobium sp.]|uniref:carboxymuconolactone decarboxylase family protein n=1 Tax=Novosphingobium sp. TaxID=1874826 RepID=UPI001DED15BB|nr:carboxymuconolactone decarboxylase family protein [Novosphingobium sp.]MBX9662431.1 carboxymuconolactone decarboxylase family protein [Novosphingobium sp.]
MTAFTVPTRDTVSAGNQGLFDALNGQLGFVPNLYATLAHSNNALGTYLALQSAKSSINAKAREVVNLVVSQVNDCAYCLAAHTALGKMNGFSDAQILEIRAGSLASDAKLDALARLTRSIAVNRGQADEALVDAFFAAGWTKENLVDVIVTIGDKMITNYLHAVTKVPVDFPAAPALDIRLAA